MNNYIDTIWKIKKENQFRKYIDFIQFPYYRNIENDTRISFDFPLTVFVGQNGCGKSSCLHALYGMPQGYTPYEFWFDTKVDPIMYYNDKKKRHSFWYSFKNEKGKIKEVIKARIKRKDDPNYWETSRPLVWAGMKTRKDNDRDKPIKKNVIYIDFRAELSAFDKYFYFGNTKGIKSRNKQDYIRYQSNKLKRIISGKKKIINKSNGQYNKEIKELNKEEIKNISFILGKTYISAKYIEHSFFRNEGFSVIFNADHAIYSEAFAGSGEVAVVRLVLKILNAPEYSLILLDEPEVSLHPGAQERLKKFLLEQIKLKKHQIILTSHSPSIIKGLPNEAIKVFHQNPSNGRFLIKEGLTPEEAFYHLEFSVNDKTNIIVEDVLAKSIIEGVLNVMGDETKNLFNVKFNPGGVAVIKKEFITVYCRDEQSNNYIFFDGDQKPDFPVLNWGELPTSLITVDYLKQEIKKMTDVEINFSVDGNSSGGRQDQKLELLKKYLDFYSSNVFYLPETIPEDIIWDKDKAKQLIDIDNISNDDILLELDSINNSKKKFALIAKNLYGSDDANDIASIHKMFLKYWLQKKNENFEYIKDQLRKILDNN